MSTQFYYYWQQTAESAWIEALAESREQIVATKRPQFATVLDLSELITEQHTREQLAKVHYKGPFHADFDHPDTDFVTAKVQQFVGVLMEKGVNPEGIRLYATGGRGFHVELAQAFFIAKPPAKGLPNLPAIYKEMAYELFVDSLDMRIYSGRKGRQWRVPGVERDNGKFKVPITVDELLVMTPEKYAELCSAPRAAPTLAPPVFNSDLGLLFAKASQKVDAAVKRAAGSKVNAAVLQRFKGEWPASAQRLMKGDAIAKDVGFQQISMQLAITANALGKSEQQLLAECEGLIETHQSDGHRYSTPSKRRAELSRMWEYTKGNVCYEFAPAALKKLIAPGVDTADLDGMSAEAGESLSAPAEGAEADDLALRGGLEMRERGIYKKDPEQGIVMICDLAFRDVGVLQSMPSKERPAELWGFEADVLLKGKLRGRQQIDMQVFLSKQRFQEFAMKNLGVMKGTDNDVASLSTIMRDSAEINGKISHVVRREGFDIVQRPGDLKTRDLVWVQDDGVHGGPPGMYVYRPLLPSGSLFATDLWDAPPLGNSADEIAFLDALFGINEPFVLGTLLGWLTAAFHRGFYQDLYRAFPICHIFGMAGSGKTQTALLLGQMHYHQWKPQNVQASGTIYTLEMHMTSSSSVPFILDEYKPREFSKDHKGRLLSALRAIYNNAPMPKGGDGDQIGRGWKAIAMNPLTAPLLMIGEALETQTGVMERTVAVPLSKAGLAGRGDKFRFVSRQRTLLGRLGRSILDASFGLDFEALREKTELNLEETTNMFREGQDRPALNLAIVLTGFDFMAEVIRHKMGGRFDTQLATLRAAIKDDTKQVSASIMAEASKVMDALALISKTEEPLGSSGLLQGRDYAYHHIAGQVYLDLRLDTAFIKYAQWCNAKAQERLYDNYAAFCEGLAHYAPMVDKRCGDSAIRESGNTKVYRLSLVKLTDEGVQTFKNQP